MISKELLGEIINDEVISFKVFNSEIDCFVGIESGEEIIDTYNIYELAHKCKEWASKIGVHLHSWLNNCEIRSATGQFEKKFIADTEPEAIFKACKWIKDRLG